MSTVCPPLCTDRLCASISGIGPSTTLVTYSLQDSIYTNGDAITVIVDCLPGYFFPGGNCPVTITYPGGTFIIPLTPLIPGPIVIALMGCQSLVQIILPAGSSAAAIAAAAASVILQVAQQQAICDVVGEPEPPTGPEGPTPPVPPGPGTPNPVPQFFNQAVYYSCDVGAVISYTGNVPGWLTVDTTNNRLVMNAGTIGASTQAAANSGAQIILNDFGDDAVIGGELVCVCITNSSTLPVGTVGVPYSVQLVAAGPGAYTFTLASGSLPAGLTLSSAGLISGTPTTAEAPNFIVTATPP